MKISGDDIAVVIREFIDNAKATNHGYGYTTGYFAMMLERIGEQNPKLAENIFNQIQQGSNRLALRKEV